jgi:hypothetical protein
MKLRFWLLLWLTAASLWANPVTLRGPGKLKNVPAQLVGECVEVQVLSNVGIVSGVYQFKSWYSTEQKKVYLPVFVSTGETANAALARMHLEIEIGDERFEEATPCNPPVELAAPRAGVRVQWYAVDIDDHAEAISTAGDRAVIRIRYDQPLFGGVFYYIPLIIGRTRTELDQRDWSFQLHAVAASHAIRVVSEGVDFERLAGGVVAFLRDRQLVALK